MGFLRRLFKSAPRDPSLPLGRALDAAEALKAMPEMGADKQKDRTLVGLIGNLKSARDALASGKDEEGIPLSRTEIADRLRRTAGYMSQHGIWDRLQAGSSREARASLGNLAKAIKEADKALRE